MSYKIATSSIPFKTFLFLAMGGVGGMGMGKVQGEISVNIDVG